MVFGGDQTPSMPDGRYRVVMVAGELRQKSHEGKVQEALNEGASRGWRLVSATTTNATGSWVSSLYWDTSPDRT